MKKVMLSLFAILLIAMNCCKQEDKLIYKNPNAPIDERVEDLLSRMTIAEKFGQVFMVPYDLSDDLNKYKDGIFGFQLHTNSNSQSEQILDYSAGSEVEEAAEQSNRIQRFFVEETRLGIPVIFFDEALHGLVRKDATAFPQAIALAASWDTSLVADVAQAIAMEVKSRGIRQILSPVLNIARDVRWGRTEETYGEDPFLTTQMAVSFISEFEKSGVITTPKHFIANVGDGGRDSYPIHFNERLLEEVYFPAFKTVFQKAHAGSVMTSYNSLDGRPCSANNWLLNKKLKEEWGFDGFVISDANAVGGANVLHFTSDSYAESGKQAIENGLDVIFQTSYDHKELFYPAFENGGIDEGKLNEAVRRVLQAKFKLGLFENPYVDPEEALKWNGTKGNRNLAKKAALESIVLLKNENNTLPISKNIQSLAVIGVDAEEARLGGYSGPGNNPLSILEGIEKKVGESCTVSYSPGCGRFSEELKTIPAESFIFYENGNKKNGLKGEYFNNINFEGEPVLVRTDPKIDFNWTLYSPDQEKVNYDYYSARWTGKLIPSETGNFEIGLRSDDGYRLFVNNELVVDNWKKQTFQEITTSYSFVKNEEYDIKIEFYETTGNVRMKLVWNLGVENNWQKEIKQAVNLAKTNDFTVVVVGINEGEANDRAFLSLPGHQEELINAVTLTGKPFAVVLVAGSAVTMSNWINNAPAILDVWYPGEEGGNAVADVLFGDYNPAGRLPITFPVFEGQLPLFYNHKPTGRLDDYTNLTGKPLFPFGFGLSYTFFEYSDFQIDDPQIAPDDSTTIRFKISNIGNYNGDEVVQLYIKDLYASVVRPITELKGFQRVHLEKGETKEFSFQITPELLSVLDLNLKKVVEPGDFRIMIGSTSNDIRLRGILKVNEE